MCAKCVREVKFHGNKLSQRRVRKHRQLVQRRTGGAEEQKLSYRGVGKSIGIPIDFRRATLEFSGRIHYCRALNQSPREGANRSHPAFASKPRTRGSLKAIDARGGGPHGQAPEELDDGHWLRKFCDKGDPDVIPIAQ